MAKSLVEICRLILEEKPFDSAIFIAGLDLTQVKEMASGNLQELKALIKTLQETSATYGLFLDVLKWIMEHRINITGEKDVSEFIKTIEKDTVSPTILIVPSAAAAASAPVMPSCNQPRIKSQQGHEISEAVVSTSSLISQLPIDALRDFLIQIFENPTIQLPPPIMPDIFSISRCRVDIPDRREIKEIILLGKLNDARQLLISLNRNYVFPAILYIVYANHKRTTVVLSPENLKKISVLLSNLKVFSESFFFDSVTVFRIEEWDRLKIYRESVHKFYLDTHAKMAAKVLDIVKGIPQGTKDFEVAITALGTGTGEDLRMAVDLMQISLPNIKTKGTGCDYNPENISQACSVVTEQKRTDLCFIQQDALEFAQSFISRSLNHGFGIFFGANSAGCFDFYIFTNS